MQGATSREKITRRDRYARLRGRASLGGALVADVALRRGSLDALCVHQKPIAFIRQSPHTRVVSHASSSPPSVRRSHSRIDRIADRPIAIPLDPTWGAFDLSRVSRRPVAPMRDGISTETFPRIYPRRATPSRVGAPSTASAIPSSCPSTAKPSDAPFRALSRRVMIQ